jgi:hypothetical protein
LFHLCGAELEEQQKVCSNQKIVWIFEDDEIWQRYEYSRTAHSLRLSNSNMTLKIGGNAEAAVAIVTKYSEVVML